MPISPDPRSARRLSLHLLPLILVGATSCSGSGGSAPPARHPELAIGFPSDGAVTTAPQVTVRGIASQPVTAVVVDGLAANTADAFQNWQAIAQLGQVPRRLAIEFQTDPTSPLLPATTLGLRRVGGLLEAPTSMAFGPGGQAVVFDDAIGALLEIDVPGAGNRVVSDAERGTGPALGSIGDAVYDPTGTAIYAIAPPDRVYEIDVATGNRTLLPDPTTAGLFWNPGALALDAARNRLLVAGGFYNDLIAIELDAASRGRRTRVSGNGAGSGIALRRPEDLAVDEVGSRALVVCEDTQNVIAIDVVDLGLGVGHREEVRGGFIEPSGIAIDPQTQRVYVVDTGNSALYELPSLGGLRIVAGGFQSAGNGPTLMRPRRVDFAPGAVKATVLDTTGNALVDVDVDSGDRSIRHRPGAATGPEPIAPRGICRDVAAQRALLVDRARAIVLAIDLVTGERTVFSSGQVNSSVGTGPGFEAPAAIALDPTRGRVLVTDLDHVIAVDLVNGDRTALTGALSGQVPPQEFVHLDIDDGQTALLATATELWTLDLETGLAEVASSSIRGAGAVFTSIHGIAADPTNRRAIALATTATGDGLFGVDVTTGNRIQLSGATVGGGPPLSSAQALTYDASTGLAWVKNDTSILTVATGTGVRFEIAGPGRGNGPALSHAAAMCFGATNDTLLVSASTIAGVLAIDRPSGERVLMSR